MKIFVTIFDDADLLPHFLQHYTENGYRHIIVGLSRAPGAVPRSEVEAHCQAARSTDILLTLEEFGDPGTLRNAEGDRDWVARARAFWCGADEWHGIADLDEHHVYPGGLFATTLRAEDEGAHYVGGHLVDQVAANGSLLPVPRLPTTLREAFPASRRITGTILGCFTSKVCLARGHLAIGGGHHFALAPGARPSSQAIEVLHYKWHSRVLRRLSRRVQDYRQQGSPYTVRSERALSYLLLHNGFDMEDDSLY